MPQQWAIACCIKAIALSYVWHYLWPLTRFTISIIKYLCSTELKVLVYKSNLLLDDWWLTLSLYIGSSIKKTKSNSAGSLLHIDIICTCCSFSSKMTKTCLIIYSTNVSPVTPAGTCLIIYTVQTYRHLPQQVHVHFQTTTGKFIFKLFTCCSFVNVHSQGITQVKGVGTMRARSWYSRALATIHACMAWCRW